MSFNRRENNSITAILYNMILAAVSLFINGFGIYLTIQANIGVSPWDVLNTGLANTFDILYGNASITVSLIILVIDIIMREPIGIAMFIDAVVVGKAVDFYNYFNVIPKCNSFIASILVMFAGFFVLAITQYTYMIAALGCGPVMQFVFKLVRFDATEIKHQKIKETLKVLINKA